VYPKIEDELPIDVMEVEVPVTMKIVEVVTKGLVPLWSMKLGLPFSFNDGVDEVKDIGTTHDGGV